MSLAWTLEVSDQARRQLKKLDRSLSDRITRAVMDVADLENPRDRGAPMSGNFAGHWRCRVGDYRVITRIEDKRIVILVLSVGHRREVYR